MRKKAILLSILVICLFVQISDAKKKKTKKKKVKIVVDQALNFYSKNHKFIGYISSLLIPQSISILIFRLKKVFEKNFLLFFFKVELYIVKLFKKVFLIFLAFIFKFRKLIRYDLIL